LADDVKRVNLQGMSTQETLLNSAQVLRDAAARLLTEAEALESAADAAAASAPEPKVPVEPLAPSVSDDETAARLIVLEAATNGRERDSVRLEIERNYPSVDAESLIERFYK